MYAQAYYNLNKCVKIQLYRGNLNTKQMGHFYKQFKKMKQNHIFLKRSSEQTQLSEGQLTPIAPIRKQRRRKAIKYQRQFKRLLKIANYMKILRFRAPNLKKTLRVYCYEQKILGWPRKFTKQLNKIVSDNDRDSDQQLIEDDKNRCLKSLFQALQERKKQRQQTGNN